MDHYITMESKLKEYSDYLLKFEKNIYEMTYHITYIIEKLEWQDKIYDRTIDMLNELIKKINLFIEDVDCNAYILDKMYEVLLQYSRI